MSSLVVASLDIGRALANKEAVTFRAKGTCMYPTVRPGDALTIQSRSVADILVGDIAVCRSTDILFAHRVIGKGEHEGRVYIVTRPDRSRNGSDPPTFDENLLGRVKVIMRDGQCKQIQPTSHPKYLRFYHQIRVAVFDSVKHLRCQFTKFIRQLDDNIIFSFIRWSWLAIVRPRLTYAVRVPLNATLGDAVYKNFDIESFDPEVVLNGKRLRRWMLTLHLDCAREPSGWVVFERDNSNSWCIVESKMRIRYRGTNLQKKINIKAKSIIGATHP